MMKQALSQHQVFLPKKMISKFATLRCQTEKSCYFVYMQTSLFFCMRSLAGAKLFLLVIGIVLQFIFRLLARERYRQRQRVVLLLDSICSWSYSFLCKYSHFKTVACMVGNTSSPNVSGRECFWDLLLLTVASRRDTWLLLLATVYPTYKAIIAELSMSLCLWTWCDFQLSKSLSWKMVYTVETFTLLIDEKEFAVV